MDPGLSLFSRMEGPARGESPKSTLQRMALLMEHSYHRITLRVPQSLDSLDVVWETAVLYCCTANVHNNYKP